MDYIGLINLIIVMYKVKFYWGGGILGSPPPCMNPWYGYYDACRKWNGDRVFLNWKFLLLIFRAAKRKKLKFYLYKIIFYSPSVKQHNLGIVPSLMFMADIPCDLFIEQLKTGN